ncbi:MAG TPA: hypothetical protein VKA30_08145 [Actinomycetota bacterium]|nr:hypothetical protein [Actinomycetota bacterium]
MGQGQSKPQQRELDRSGRGKVDPDRVKGKQDVWNAPKAKGRTGPVPPDNQPGHHPKKDQDQP